MMESSQTTTAQNYNSTPPNANLMRTQKAKSFLVSRFKVTSLPLKVLVVWSLFEILLCVLWYKTENHVDNFLNGICNKNRCPHFLEHSLYGRIILSTISIIGIFMGFNSLMSIWFLMNALGVFPLLPVIYSCFDTYKELNERLENASNL